jgi:hypothetical protein
MTNDDITQKLSLLPEGLAEENLRTWQHIVRLFEFYTSPDGGSQLKPVLDLVKVLSTSSQAKLFRAGASLYFLMISTNEKHGLEQGDAYIGVSLENDDSFDVYYFAATAQEAETFHSNKDEIMPTLQPLLNRLWTETRGKKNA